jgi:hypothetical protein
MLLTGIWSFVASATQDTPAPSLDSRDTAAPAIATANPDAVELPPSGIDRLAESLLVANLPREYENSKHWGQTKQVWDGLEVHRQGLSIHTKRRWKTVNHGTWTKYRAWLIDPHRDLHLKFENLRRAGNDRTAFELIIDARLGATGRLSEWNRGVQLYSFHADAEATVRLQLSCDLSLDLDATRLPPDVLLVPRITAGQLALRDFQLQRISSVDGPLVRKLGDLMRDDIEREINERQAKLVEKMNRSLEKHQDELRISVRDLLASGWNRFVSVPAKPEK